MQVRESVGPEPQTDLSIHENAICEMQDVLARYLRRFHSSAIDNWATRPTRRTRFRMHSWPAGALGLAEGTVKAELSRARVKLTRLMRCAIRPRAHSAGTARLRDPWLDVENRGKSLGHPPSPASRND